MKPRFVHSFWTKPALGVTANNDRQKVVYDLWVFAMSAWHIRNNGHTIVLHTDAVGEELFSRLPYDNIYRTLDKIDVDKAFWAASKMVAQEAEPLGSIHIDGDVFIKKPDILNKIAALGYDLIIERRTNLHCNPSITEKMLPYIKSTLPEWFDTETTKAYNTGVTGFNNQALKDRFLRKFWQWSKLLTSAEDYVKHPTQSDLIIEMGWLRQLAEHKDLKVKELYRHAVVDGSGEKKESGLKESDKKPQIKLDKHGEPTDWSSITDRIWSDGEGYEHNYMQRKYYIIPQIIEFMKSNEPKLYKYLCDKIIPTLY